uniref:Uncharacterized protein n=1 Tax=Anopheles darlingi TaxID=43151 RepID=A0A2M4D208_ANODA
MFLCCRYFYHPTHVDFVFIFNVLAPTTLSSVLTDPVNPIVIFIIVFLFIMYCRSMLSVWFASRLLLCSRFIIFCTLVTILFTA